MERPICPICLISPVMSNLRGGWRKKCSGCNKKPYRKYRKDCCEKCGFKPEHICQLDVDHKDGDRKNNSPSNLQTLCANCHRLKTYLNKDFTSF